MLTFHITLCARQEAKYSSDSSLPLHEETSNKEKNKGAATTLGCPKLVARCYPEVILNIPHWATMVTYSM